LFLSEFFDAAMLRANRSQHGEKPRQYVLYLDEFQQYITNDIAAMLEEVRKGGLHIVLAHQHLGQLIDDPRLKESIFSNARLRAVFGGLSYPSAVELANEMFLPDLNTRQIKKAYYHTIHLYREETRTVLSNSKTRGSSNSAGTSTGSGSAGSSGTVISSSHGSTSPGLGSSAVEGWYSDSEGWSEVSASSSSDFYATTESHSTSESETSGETTVPVWVPIPKQELGSEAEWGREEKVSKVAEMLKCQQQRHCFIKLDTEQTQPLMVPFVKDVRLPAESLLEYQREVYAAQGALAAPVVDRLIEESQQKFISAAQSSSTVIDITPEPVTSAEPAIPQGPLWTRTRKPARK
jgi:hypothetical protein